MDLQSYVHRFLFLFFFTFEIVSSCYFLGYIVSNQKRILSDLKQHSLLSVNSLSDLIHIYSQGVYVCACVHVSASLCTCVCWFVWRHMITWGTIITQEPYLPFFFLTGSLIVWNSLSQLGWPRESFTCLYLACVGIINVCTSPALSCEFWGPNSGPHACIASDLPTEPSPCPCLDLLYFKFCTYSFIWGMWCTCVDVCVPYCVCGGQRITWLSPIMQNPGTQLRSSDFGNKCFLPAELSSPPPRADFNYHECWCLHPKIVSELQIYASKCLIVPFKFSYSGNLLLSMHGNYPSSQA